MHGQPLQNAHHSPRICSMPTRLIHLDSAQRVSKCPPLSLSPLASFHCDGKARLPVGGLDSAGYARICAGMCKYARVCSSMRDYARVCVGMREYARVCAGMRGYARVRSSMPEYARVRASMPEYAHVCASMREYARECASRREYALVCASIARVFASMRG